MYFSKFHIKFYFSKFHIKFLSLNVIKVKEFVSIERNLFLVTSTAKSL